MKSRKLLLLLIISLNYNCKKMETANCFDTHKFSEILNIINEKGQIVLLDTKLITQRNTNAKEFVFENYALEFLEKENDKKIIIIDDNHVIPIFTVAVIDSKISFSAYESRIDTDEDIKQRRESWCYIVTNILK